MVTYLTNVNINKAKWNDCIRNASNGLIYAQSFYLDIMADNWDALILNDYEAVMPLTWRKKYFIKYLYQPPFTQQLGIFFKQPLSIEIYKLFTEAAFTHFKFAEIYLNHANADAFAGLCTPRINYILDINKNYSEIKANYLEGFTKSLRRITKFNFQYKQSQDIDEVLTLYIKLYGERVAHLCKKDYAAFRNLCKVLQQNQQLIIRQAFNESNGIVALALLFKDENRLYNIISCLTQEGRRLEANYFLYDNIIQEFCNSNILLDMEGSDIKGVAEFYEKLNPVNQPYFFLKYNHLHPIVKILKR
jgi:hypothetical protein